jgi:hypothetical protein
MPPKPASHPALAASVVKKNALVPALAGFHLSELRLLAFCLAKLGSTATKSRAITVRVAEMCDLFQMDKPSAYSVIKEVMVSIGAKPAEFDIGTKKHLYFWFSSLEYEANTGEFTFRISPEMKPYLLELAGNFTMYRLADVYRFSSASAWKLYENLARWRSAGKWSVDLDELRELLGVAGKYPLWSRLKIDLLDPALEQINAQTDLTVVYEPTKRGRRFTGLSFVIRTLDASLEVLPRSPVSALCDLLKSAGLSAKTAMGYAERIDSKGLTESMTAKLPGIIERAATAKTSQVAYIVGSLNKEMNQLDLFEAEKNEPPHKAALDCWTKKRQAGEACTVRERGKAGQRKKCQICLEKLPVAEWGV